MMSSNEEEEKYKKLIPLDEIFEAYCQMDPISASMGVKLLPLSQSDKWLSEAKILDMMKLTKTDTGLCFFKFRKRAISFPEYLTYLEDLAQTKNLNLKEMKLKMQSVNKPIDTRNLKGKLENKIN